MSEQHLSETIQEHLPDTGEHESVRTKGLAHQSNAYPTWRVEALYDGCMLP